MRPRDLVVYVWGVRPRALAGLFVAVGLLALHGAAVLLEGARAPRPEGAGEIGEVTVYAQSPRGPVPLTAGRTARLARPQALAFQLSARGTGPRLVRLAVDTGEGAQHLHEEQILAPARQVSLRHVARFGEEAPDALTLEVTVEAPHARPRTRRYPIRLETESHRFWDPEADAPRGSSERGRATPGPARSGSPAPADVGPRR